MPFPSQAALKDALESAGAAHHDYQQNILDGQNDVHWPGWYAAYVLGRLGDFSPPSVLSQWLEEAPMVGEWTEQASQYVSTQLLQL